MKPLDVEIAFAAVAARAGGVVKGAAGQGAVVELEADQVLARDAADVRVRDADVHHVDDIQDDAAVLRAGGFHQGQGVLEVVDHRAGHDLEADGRAVILRLFAQRGEGLDEARHGADAVVEIADF